MPRTPWTNENRMEGKTYYKIKEVTEIVGENASTLRFWENEFKDLTPKRNVTGRRYYTAEDIELIRIIKYLLRTKGMHISTAKEQLRTNRKNLGMRAGAIAELEEVKKELELLLTNMNKLR